MNTQSTANIRPIPVTCIAVLTVLTVACGRSGWDPESPDAEAHAEAPISEAAATVAAFQAKDPSIQPYFENCSGYVVFPTVGKGGFWVGGAHGKGEVYENGRFVGTASITQLTAGPQIGGQAYSEIIFFEDTPTLGDFKKGNFELGAQVSAVAIEEGGAHHAAYEAGIAIFTLTKKGLMAEATVAGQKFDYHPVDG